MIPLILHWVKLWETTPISLPQKQDRARFRMFISSVLRQVLHQQLLRFLRHPVSLKDFIKLSDILKVFILIPINNYLIHKIKILIVDFQNFGFF